MDTAPSVGRACETLSAGVTQLRQVMFLTRPRTAVTLRENATAAARLGFSGVPWRLNSIQWGRPCPFLLPGTLVASSLDLQWRFARPGTQLLRGNTRLVLPDRLTRGLNHLGVQTPVFHQHAALFERSLLDHDQLDRAYLFPNRLERHRPPAY